MICTLKLHRSANGNWALEPTNVPHDFPPIAFPGSLTVQEIQRSTAAMLEQAKVPAPKELRWTVYGHTPDGTYALQARWRVEITAL